MKVISVRGRLKVAIKVTPSCVHFSVLRELCGRPNRKQRQTIIGHVLDAWRGIFVRGTPGEHLVLF